MVLEKVIKEKRKMPLSPGRPKNTVEYLKKISERKRKKSKERLDNLVIDALDYLERVVKGMEKHPNGTRLTACKYVIELGDIRKEIREKGINEGYEDKVKKLLGS